MKTGAPVLRLLCAALLLSSPVIMRAEDPPANRFVYAVLKRDAADPYGDLWPQIGEELVRYTSLRPWPARRQVGWNDPELFESPFLLVQGRGALTWSDADLARLRDYLSGGGFLLLDNAEADKGGPFARSVTALPARLMSGGGWKEIPVDHAVYRSFFLLRGAAGRRRAEGKLWGLWWEDRLAAVYAPDDLHGAWVRSATGGWLFPCEPGGEPQRREAQKLLLNLIMYSLTGTYKTDAVHQEFLKRRWGEQ